MAISTSEPKGSPQPQRSPRDPHQSITSSWGLYLLLVVYRFYMASRQTGYIHPDEFFQSPEPVAGSFHSVVRPGQITPALMPLSSRLCCLSRCIIRYQFFNPMGIYASRSCEVASFSVRLIPEELCPMGLSCLCNCTISHSFSCPGLAWSHLVWGSGL